MTRTHSIRLHALCEADDERVIAAAAEALSEALSNAGEGAIKVDFQARRPSLSDVMEAALPVLMFLSAWRDKAAEDWPKAESSLKDIVSKLAERHPVVFLCTIFRHVSGQSADERNLRVAIRRLNLLAVQLSQSYNALVIDLDRDLADIGAIALGADFQLHGEPAERYAGGAIALTVLGAGLDDHASYEAQERARQTLLDQKRRAQGLAASSIAVRQGNAVAWGAGRRRQTAATTLNTMQDQHVGWLLRNLAEGKIDAHFAWDKLRQSIARRGLWASFVRLLSGAGALLKSRVR